MTRSCTLILACIFLLSGPSFPSWAEPLRYVFTQYKPANFIDDQNKPSGFFVEIIREAVENRLGIELEMKVYPWRRCQAMVESGKADMITTIPTEERLGYTILVDSPIWIKKYMAYTYMEHPLLEQMNNIRSVEDLKKGNFTVISYIGNNWSETHLKDNGIPLINAPTVESMYRMLSGKRGDLVVEDPVLVTPTLATVGLTDRIVLTQGVLGESRFHPLIGKNSPYVTLAPKLERVLRDMWKDGTIARIMKAYH